MTCDQYFGVIPWPQFAFAVAIGLLFGAFIGIYVERHAVVPRLLSLIHPSRVRRKKGHER